MANLSGTKRKVTLETSQAVFEDGALRQVIAEMQDGFVVLHLRGLKTSFAIPWGAVYHLAAAQAAERELRVRRAEIGI